SQKQGVVFARVAKRHLKRVVARIPDGAFEAVVAERRTERSARSVEDLSGSTGVLRIFLERSAGSRSLRNLGGFAQSQTQRGISRIYRVGQDQVMRLRADVGNTQYRVGA